MRAGFFLGDGHLGDWYVQIDGDVLGPLSAGDLVDLAGKGTLKRTDQVARQAGGPWCEANRVKGLFPPAEERPVLADVAPQPPPQPQPTQFRGPPYDCARCGGALLKTRRAPQEGIGCLLLIVGIVLTPLLIGIPVVVAGIFLMCKTEHFYQCRRCGQKVPA